MLPQPFDGYPYVVTRIGHTALRSVAVVPSDWSRERLVDLARRQAIANQLETCLCLGPAESVFVTPDGTATRSDFVPVGIPVLDGLALADRIPETAELAARRARLAAFRESLNPQWFPGRRRAGRRSTRHGRQHRQALRARHAGDPRRTGPLEPVRSLLRTRR